MSITIEESDESLYWMELSIEAAIISESRLSELMAEANELVTILTASVITTRKSIKKEGIS
jgi:hypothetical protein